MARTRGTVLFSVSLASAICFSMRSLLDVRATEKAKGVEKTSASAVAKPATAAKPAATQVSPADKMWKELNAKNYRLAIKTVDLLLAQEPKNAPAYFVKGKALSELGEKDRAINEISHAIKLDPKMDRALADQHNQV